MPGYSFRSHPNPNAPRTGLCAGFLAVLIAFAAAAVSTYGTSALAQGAKPEPWKPKPPSSTIHPASDSTTGSAHQVTAPKVPADVQRLDSLVYDPSAADTVLPYTNRWVDIPASEKLTGYVGTLRQGTRERFFPIVMPEQSVHVEVNGGKKGARSGVALFLPWLGPFVRLPHTTARLLVKLDDGPEREQKLLFTPGPVMFSDEFPRPLPVSAPGLFLVDVPSGRHRLTLRVLDLQAPYMFLQVGQPHPSI